MKTPPCHHVFVCLHSLPICSMNASSRMWTSIIPDDECSLRALPSDNDVIAIDMCGGEYLSSGNVPSFLPSILPQSAVTLFQSSSSLVVTTSVDDLIAIMTIDWCCYMYKCIEGNTIWLHRGLKLCRNPLVEVLPLRGIVLRSSPASRSMTSKVICNCHFATQQLIHLVKELAEFSYFVSSKQVFFPTRKLKVS